MEFKYKHLLILTFLSIGVFILLSFGEKHPDPTSTPFPHALEIATSRCWASYGLPDKNCTPGVIDISVTQDNIQSTICKRGYTETIRPPVSYTNRLKLKQIEEYGYADTNPKDYEEDHLISLELGGNPKDEKNLWPEPYNIASGAREKDKVENYLHKQVCDGIITLDEAQKEISQNWVEVYQKISH